MQSSSSKHIPWMSAGIAVVSLNYALEKWNILYYFTGIGYFHFPQCLNLGPVIFEWLFQEFLAQATQLYWQFSLPSPPDTPLKENPNFSTANLTVTMLCIVLLQGDQKTSQRQIWLISPETVKPVKKNFSWVQFQHCAQGPATDFRSAFRATQRLCCSH